MRKKFSSERAVQMRSDPTAATIRAPFGGGPLPAFARCGGFGGPARRSAQREGGSGLDHLDQLDRLLALRAGAVAHHFFEQLARAVLYAQIDIAARQIQ